MALASEHRASVLSVSGLGRRVFNGFTSGCGPVQTDYCSGSSCISKARGNAGEDSRSSGHYDTGRFGSSSTKVGRTTNHHGSGRRGWEGAGVKINEQSAYPLPEESAQPQKSMFSLWSQGGKAVQAWLFSTIEDGRSRIRFRTSILTVENGRVWIHKYRCHHGLTGVLLVSVGVAIKQPALVLAGAVLCWDDKEDYPWPMST